MTGVYDSSGNDNSAVYVGRNGQRHGFGTSVGVLLLDVSFYICYVRVQFSTAHCTEMEVARRMR
jgi:hypothetical protein